MVEKTAGHHVRWIDKCKASTHYALYGFKTLSDAIRRYEELIKINPRSVKSVCMMPGEDIPVIIITEDAFISLTEDEKLRIAPGPIIITTVDYNPTLYRFIDEKYIDMFFDRGIFRLSSFKRCKKLEDKNRQDTKEGNAILTGFDGKYTMKLDIGVGDDAFLLCTSLSSNNIKFDGTLDGCCLMINDSNKFIDIISHKLIQDGYPLYKILKGPCVYSTRHIERIINDGIVEDFLHETDNKSTIDMNKLFDIAYNIGKYDFYFRKPLDKRFENEYRILWFLEDIPNLSYVDICIPEAIKFCNKIKF